jgi:DNA gyrase subunit B
VAERHVIDARITSSLEAHALDALAPDLQSVYARHSTLVSGDREFAITGPGALLEAVMELGRKGISFQRYKGLGEMNPEQLWETTLDANVRSLLRVKVDHADEAGDIFETLMGDIVEPRRIFIQENALKVENLDV